MKLTLAQAAQFMGAAGEFDPTATARGYSIDSRTLQPGDLFFAVRGESLDGHDFVEVALRNLTTVAREFARAGGGSGRVLTVFGCGGDRDRAKRPLMGEAAGRGSDFVVVTSDNPRSEDPQAIIQEAVTGLRRTGTRFTVEPDRARAIALAIAEARPGDIVLVAGKGHENVQVTRTGSAPFDDVAVARDALARLGYAAAQTGGRR